MKLRCPQCRALLQVGEDFADPQARCGACGAVVDVPRPATRCPVCREPVEPGAALCTNCGFNLRTGQRVRTATEADEPKPEDPGPPPVLRPILVLGEWLPGLLRPRVVLASIVVGLIGLAILGLAALMFVFGAIFTTFMVGAVGIIIWAQAVVWLIDGELAVLTEALVDLEGARWLLFFVLLLVPFAALIAAVHFAVS